MDIKISYKRIDDIDVADVNPKDHDLGVLIMSINRFGFNVPLIINDTSGKLVAGHGRLQALISMYSSKYGLPKNIMKDDDGMWLAPVMVGNDFANEEEAMAYLLADNKLTELGGWDSEKLLEGLKGIDNLEGVGYDSEDIQNLYEDIRGNENKVEPVDSDRGLGNPRVIYRLVFDNKDQQERWYKYLHALYDEYSDVESIGSRVILNIQASK